MKAADVEQQVTLWMAAEAPIRMFYGGRRWRVTDTPTRVRESVWSTVDRPSRGMYGWRFQATDEAGESFVFDLYRAVDGWHVHHVYD